MTPQINYYTADIVSSSDYYPFGMSMKERSFSSPEYRYGFNGMEKDEDVKGDGNSYTTFFRQLDPRIGRWLSYDPKATSWESPYASMGNNPVWYNDPMGDKFGVKDQERINEHKKEVDAQIKKQNKKLANPGSLSTEKITEITAIRDDLMASLDEISALQTSTTKN